MAAIAGVIGVIGSIGGTIVSAAGASYQAKAQAQQMQYQARVEERNASERLAVSQRQGEQKRAEGDFLISRQRAIAASQGGDTTDPTVLDIFGNTASQAEMNAQNAEYEGNTAAQDMQAQAVNYRIGASNALTAGKYNVASTIMSGMSNFASKYGGSGFNRMGGNYYYG